MRDKSLPPKPLDEIRCLLGDAGIPHSLRVTKGGWPYIRFRPPTTEVEISLQYRSNRKDRKTGVRRPAHFLVFSPCDSGGQNRLEFRTPAELIAHLCITDEMTARHMGDRDRLGMAERAVSILPPDQEASYLAMMR